MSIGPFGPQVADARRSLARIAREILRLTDTTGG